MIYSICSVCKFADSCDSAKTIDPFCLNYEKRPETNADRIRSMSDEELDDFIEAITPHENWSLFLDGMRWLDWLQSPVDGGDPK